ncbi:hypothetical protein F4802DRAFT_619165 [Xylaria palmicola]|nr:hypothetical protein F4802DRAFT_619165 [Xylaria palmicola]
MDFQITQILAQPSFNTSNSQFICNARSNNASVIWAYGTDKQFNEAQTGSNRCVTFQLVKNPATGKWSPLKISVKGNAAVLASWYKSPDQGPPARYKILARIDGRDWLLSSEEVSITSPVMPIDIGVMNIIQDVYEIPFRISGDLTWCIQRTDITGVPPVYFSQSTRLEMCFVFAALPPVGPWESDDVKRATRPDFQGKYYIDLFRLFLPSQWEVIDSIQSSSTLDDRLKWYIQRSMQVIWDLGLEPHAEYPKRPVTLLNPTESESFYLSPIQGVSRNDFVPQYGGIFELRRWMKGSYAYCTAFDLAALTQLAVSLIRDGDGNELLDSKWIASTGNRTLGQKDWGFINPGTLFGWPRFPQCNSPCFMSGRGPSYDKAKNDNRVPLIWHSWIEVKLPSANHYTVLDVSQAFGMPGSLQIISGGHSRVEYLTMKMDAEWPDRSRLPSRTPQRRNIDAIVYYSTPETQPNRIGVLGISETDL